MREHSLLLMFSVLLLGSLLTPLFWYNMDNKDLKPRRQPRMKHVPHSCHTCGEEIKKALEIYSQPWSRQEENALKYRTELKSQCRGYERAVVTQTNTPVGKKVTYAEEKKKTVDVDMAIFKTFIKAHPFSNHTFSSCSVVGNGGILAKSRCGKMIDSNQFVIRCNLPPLLNGFEKHVGTKTDLVTANPSIISHKFGALMGSRRSLMDTLRSYGKSLLLLPAFSFRANTPLSLRALYTIEDFESPIQPIFFNPEYLQSLDDFWRSQGMKAKRLSTGFMMTSLALELCDSVQLYGFWPFSLHPETFQELTNHYYDDKKPNLKLHAMSDEFKQLLQLHSLGVLRLHLGDCRPDDY